MRSLVIAGAMEYDNFSTQLRLMEGAFKLSVSVLSCLNTPQQILAFRQSVR